MGSTATAQSLERSAAAAAWMLVRCPIHHRVLGEVRGDLRKRCPECRAYWVYEHDTGCLTREPPPAGAGTAGPRP